MIMMDMNDMHQSLNFLDLARESEKGKSPILHFFTQNGFKHIRNINVCKFLHSPLYEKQVRLSYFFERLLEHMNFDRTIAHS